MNLLQPMGAALKHSKSEQEIEWLHFALGFAKRQREKMARLTHGGMDWIAENKRRDDSLESARRHVEQLRVLRTAIPADIALMLKAEGL
jgi:hypothetical protein